MRIQKLTFRCSSEEIAENVVSYVSTFGRWAVGFKVGKEVHVSFDSSVRFREALDAGFQIEGCRMGLRCL